MFVHKKQSYIKHLWYVNIYLGSVKRRTKSRYGKLSLFLAIKKSVSCANIFAAFYIQYDQDIFFLQTFFNFSLKIQNNIYKLSSPFSISMIFFRVGGIGLCLNFFLSQRNYMCSKILQYTKRVWRGFYLQISTFIYQEMQIIL